MSLCLSEKFIQNVSFGLKVVCCKSEKWFTLQQGIRLKAYICRELLVINSYDTDTLHRRAEPLDKLLQRVIKHQTVTISETSQLKDQWHTGVEMLSSLQQLIELQPTLTLPQSQRLQQELEEQLWTNFTTLFSITTHPAATIFVRQHTGKLYPNPEAVFYLAKLMENKDYRGAAHGLYRQLAEKSDDQAIKERCNGNMQRLKNSSTSNR